MKVNLNAKIYNVEIDKVSNKKFFGLITNENVSWEVHITLVKTTVNKNIGVVRKIRNIVPRNTLHLIYYTLIHLGLITEYCFGLLSKCLY